MGKLYMHKVERKRRNLTLILFLHGVPLNLWPNFVTKWRVPLLLRVAIFILFNALFKLLCDRAVYDRARSENA